MTAKRALITGASDRLGREMALYLADLGYDVTVHFAKSQEKAAAVVAEIVTKGQLGVAVQADLLVEDEMQSLIPKAAEALGGGLSCLINNASIFERDSLQTADRQSWDRHIESNLRAPFVLSQRFAEQVPDPVLNAAQEPVAQGLIVNMIDQRVLKPTPEFMSYTLAKMGLWAFTRTAAQALAPGVRVNGIGPGPTLKGENQTPANYSKQRGATILQRGADPKDITGALGYLLNAPAVTGQMIAVDGGQHLAWETPDVVGLE